MSFTSCAGQNVTFTFSSVFGGMAYVPPQCNRCRKSAAAFQTPDGFLWCQGCLQGEIERQTRALRAQWVDQAFAACPAGARSRLYRALAVAFHPDTDAEIMTALNAAKEQHGL